jgi:hypothetical protein
MLGQRRGGVARVEEDNGEALRRWPSSLATRGAALEQELASGGAATAASGGAAAAAEETQEEERGGGGQGVMCSFKNSRDLDVKLDFLTVLFFK